MVGPDKSSVLKTNHKKDHVCTYVYIKDQTLSNISKSLSIINQIKTFRLAYQGDKQGLIGTFK